MKKKKKNENRIPINKSACNTAEILKSSTNGMVFRTWALLLAAMSDFKDTTAQDMLGVWTAANAYPSAIQDFHDAKRMLDNIHSRTGVRFPLSYIHSAEIKTQGDLKRFTRKAGENAFGTAIAVILEPVFKNNLFTEDRLKSMMYKISGLDKELIEGRITISDIQTMLRDEYGLVLEQEHDGALLRIDTCS